MLIHLRSLLFALLLVPSAFAANGSALKADLIYLLHQNVASTNRSWPDSVLYKFLNMAQDEMAPRSGGVQDTSFVAGGSARYSQPSGFIHLKQAAWLWRNGAIIKPMQVVPWDSLMSVTYRNTVQDAGRDVFVIAEDAGQIAVFPTVNSADSILLSFYAYPTTLDSSTECSYDAGWEQVVVKAAAALCYAAIQNQFWTQYYTAERDKLIAALRALVTREPVEIKTQ